MFYFKLFELSTVGVVTVVLLNMFIYKILIEYDKSVKVKNYKKKKGFFLKLSRILFTTYNIVFILLFPIIVLYYYFIKPRVSIKSLELWSKQMLGQIFVVFEIIYISVKGLYAILYYFDAKHLIVVYETFGKVMLYYSLIFWMILYLKQNIYLYKVQKQSFEMMSAQYEGLTYKEKCNKIEENINLESFNELYCVKYETEQEWYDSPETQKCYGFYYKLFQVYSPIWIMFINIIFGIYYNDKLPSVVNIHDNGVDPNDLLLYFNYISRSYYIAGALFIKNIIIVGALIYLLIPLAIPKKIYTKTAHIVMMLLQVLLVILIALSGMKYYHLYEKKVSKMESYAQEESMEFDQYQQLISEALKNENNLETYTYAQKVDYLTSSFRNENKMMKKIGYDFIGEKLDYVFKEKYDLEEAIGSFEYVDGWMEQAKSKGYFCNRLECSISIPLSNDKFNHLVVYNEYINVYYQDPKSSVLEISKNSFTKEKGEYYLSKYMPEINKRINNFDLSKLTEEEQNKLLIVAFTIGEKEDTYRSFLNEDTYLNFFNEDDTPEEFVQKLEDIYEAYEITVVEVNQLFAEVTDL